MSSCVRGHIIGLSSVFLGLPEPFTVIARSAKVDLYAISAVRSEAVSHSSYLSFSLSLCGYRAI